MSTWIRTAAIATWREIGRRYSYEKDGGAYGKYTCAGYVTVPLEPSEFLKARVEMAAVGWAWALWQNGKQIDHGTTTAEHGARTAVRRRVTQILATLDPKYRDQLDAKVAAIVDRSRREVSNG